MSQEQGRLPNVKSIDVTEVSFCHFSLPPFALDVCGKIICLVVILLLKENDEKKRRIAWFSVSFHFFLLEMLSRSRILQQ